MNSFSEKPQTSQSEELRDEDVKSFFFFCPQESNVYESKQQTFSDTYAMLF